ncbi:hypothetical protein HPB49_010981 [Dermacentor silvarum]|uniref:Uncharacterized protein n=1 Tax=Dermacentor silvarum TaxID=543639 RepID=A0ACB8CX03_DERSI|nr:hypothetical protein HPB49_010981 [Dermacentor silvarum]
MDPRLHQGRREARVGALAREQGHKNITYYVDAANYDRINTKAVTAVLDSTLQELTSASIRCHNITESEETAIALPLGPGYRQTRSLTVLMDSQAARHHYLQGRFSQPALGIILSATGHWRASQYTYPPNSASDNMDPGSHRAGGKPGSGY